MSNKLNKGKIIFRSRRLITTLGSILAIPALIVTTYVGISTANASSALNETSQSKICVTATLIDNPGVSSKAGNCDSSAPELPEVPIVNDQRAVCDDIVLNSNPNVIVKCDFVGSQGDQDVVKVTVSSHETTPIKWNVEVNADRAKGYKVTNLDSPNAFDTYKEFTKKFTVVGTDRSWNANPSAVNNYAYVSDLKTITFNVRVTWR